MSFTRELFIPSIIVAFLIALSAAEKAITDDRPKSSLESLYKFPGELKRGFAAMRGKKSHIDHDDLQYHDRLTPLKAPNFYSDQTESGGLSKRPFSAMRGKKSMESDSEGHRRSFSAMRGKKSLSLNLRKILAFSRWLGQQPNGYESSNEKRFTAMRGKRSDDINNYSRQNMRQKRSTSDMSSFVALRGKKSENGEFSRLVNMRINESFLRALSNALTYGVYVSPPKVAEKRPSFNALRGKKSPMPGLEKLGEPFKEWLVDEDFDMDDYDRESNGDVIADYMFKRNVPTTRPIGFISMRGKRSID